MQQYCYRIQAGASTLNKAYVYLVDGIDRLGEDFVADNILRLPIYRQEQCNKRWQDSDRKACVLAYLLLEKGLEEHFGIGHPGSFAYGKYGKPFLQEEPNVFFSISHCKKGIACTLANVEVGIDIEEIRPFDINIARHVCSNEELSLLAESANPARLFCRIWTEKESYAKALGIGVAEVMTQVLPTDKILHLDSLALDNNYCITLAFHPAVSICASDIVIHRCLTSGIC